MNGHQYFVWVCPRHPAQCHTADVAARIRFRRHSPAVGLESKLLYAWGAGAHLGVTTMFGAVVAAPLCRGAFRTATERRGYILPIMHGGSVKMRPGAGPHPDHVKRGKPSPVHGTEVRRAAQPQPNRRAPSPVPANDVGPASPPRDGGEAFSSSCAPLRLEDQMCSVTRRRGQRPAVRLAQIEGSTL